MRDIYYLILYERSNICESNVLVDFDFSYNYNQKDSFSQLILKEYLDYLAVYLRIYVMSNELDF